jgi:hypothetical protein
MEIGTVKAMYTVVVDGYKAIPGYGDLSQDMEIGTVKAMYTVVVDGYKAIPGYGDLSQDMRDWDC